ncbi:MAG TPA: hypothetical protein VGM62_11225 [Chthoniobacterales bacterium]
MEFRPSLPLICSLCFGIALSICHAADPAAELGSFSVFDKVDLAELAKSDAKTIHGPPMGGRYLSVQSCYVMAGAPSRLVEAMRRWNPTEHRELKVYLHGDFTGSPGPGNFAKLKNAPDNGPVNAFVSATDKMGPELQISRDEAKKSGGGGSGSMSDSVVTFWSNLLSNRARLFMSGGTAAQPGYDHAASVRPNDEFKSLLKQQGKIQKQFSDFLSGTGIGRGAGSLPAENYWELLDVDDQGVVTLGASYARSGAAGAQAADILYYASGGYYVALTLHQMWPVTVDGKSSTLVWRGDMISSAALESLHGVERLASEGAMVKDISKSIALFRRESGSR